MDQLELARKAGLLEPEKVIQKRSGLEIALEALKSSKPNSPSIPYLEKLLAKEKLSTGQDNK